MAHCDTLPSLQPSRHIAGTPTRPSRRSPRLGPEVALLVGNGRIGTARSHLRCPRTRPGFPGGVTPASARPEPGRFSGAIWQPSMAGLATVVRRCLWLCYAHTQVISCAYRVARCPFPRSERCWHCQGAGNNPHRKWVDKDARAFDGERSRSDYSDNVRLAALPHTEAVSFAHILKR